MSAPLPVPAPSRLADAAAGADPWRPTLERLLREVWGYAGFRPLQREAMTAILDGRDSLVVLPTGGGKSVCFQAPALVDRSASPAVAGGLALVVSPLIALMKDQVDGLRAQGVAAAALHGALDTAERDRVWRDLQAGRLRLLYVAPERLVGEGPGSGTGAGSGNSLLALLASRGVRFVAVDEAHCISQWGHDFRPEYRRLALLRQALPGVSFHAYTATATPRVQRDIVNQLGLVEPQILVGSFDRPNLVYRVVRRAGGVAREVLQILRRHPGDAGIVYCISRRETESLAEALRREGIRAAAYHAGLPDEERHRRQDAFSEERLDVVCATVAFGMGIDRSNVRFVVHAGAPRSLEHYQQEAGRAGRDGLAAECVLLWSPADVMTWRRLLEASAAEAGAEGPPPGALQQLREIERFATSTGCRHRALVEHFGQSFGGGSCDACDRCLGELLPVEEPEVLARKILSGVARMREGFGVAQVVDVLRGRETDRVRERGHHQLSTFGLLVEHPADEVRAFVEQLVEQGFLAVEGDRYPLLRLTAPGKDLLKDPVSSPVALVRQRRPEPAGGSRRGSAGGKGRKRGPTVVAAAGSGPAMPGAAGDEALFEALRAERRRIAEERHVPPYVVFHDTTLREIARLRPATLEGLLSVHGVGQAKARDFGERMLRVVEAGGESAGVLR